MASMVRLYDKRAKNHSWPSSVQELDAQHYSNSNHITLIFSDNDSSLCRGCGKPTRDLGDWSGQTEIFPIGNEAIPQIELTSIIVRRVDAQHDCGESAIGHLASNGIE
jgi:hypothetical protein